MPMAWYEAMYERDVEGVWGDLFGAVEVRRCGYSAPEEGKPVPARWGAQPAQGQLLARAAGALGLEVARGSFDEAVRAIETTTGGQVPKRQAEELTAKVSQDFEAFYELARARDRKRPWTPW